MVGRGHRRDRAMTAAVLVAVIAVSATACGSAASGAPGAAAAPPPAPNPQAGPVGPMTAPGGPFLVDRYGRVALLHGVDLVYKLAPYEVVVDGTGPNVLTTTQVRRMAALGFDVVRLGIIWRGLEPGRGPIDEPSVCDPGAPRASGTAEFRASAYDAYVARLDATIALLGRYGIYSLLDMHQDVYSDVFGGEGAPDWAVCPDGQQPRPKLDVPDWSENLRGPGVAAAYAHFWRNDVVGDLQGQFDSLWTRLAAHERDDPWVVGYDPFNEPYAQGLPPYGSNVAFDAELQCFYMGRADPGTDQSGQTVTCPPDDPAVGIVPRLEAADPHHLVFYEPDFTTDSGVPNHVGPMAAGRLVLNFHDYCFLHVPNGPEPPGYGSTCGPLERSVFTERTAERTADTTPEQPGGPAWFLSEFGATTDADDVGRITADADDELVGWTYWQWIRYDDPTGSHDSGLWPPSRATDPLLPVLSRAYASAVAGRPTTLSFDPSSGVFTLQYRADPRITEPTVVVVPVAEHYGGGYCATVSGGRITSAPGAEHLDIVNGRGATDVRVSIVPGRC